MHTTFPRYNHAPQAKGIAIEVIERKVKNNWIITSLSEVSNDFFKLRPMMETGNNSNNITTIMAPSNNIIILIMNNISNSIIRKVY